MLELLPDGPSLSFGQDEEGRPTVEITVEPWVPPGVQIPEDRRVVVAAVVAGAAGRPWLPVDVVAQLGWPKDSAGDVVRVTAAGRSWVTNAALGPAGEPARIGRGALEVQGFRLPPAPVREPRAAPTDWRELLGEPKRLSIYRGPLSLRGVLLEDVRVVGTITLTGLLPHGPHPPPSRWRAKGQDWVRLQLWAGDLKAVSIGGWLENWRTFRDERGFGDLGVPVDLTVRPAGDRFPAGFVQLNADGGGLWLRAVAGRLDATLEPCRPPVY